MRPSRPDRDPAALEPAAPIDPGVMPATNAAPYTDAPRPSAAISLGDTHLYARYTDLAHPNFAYVVLSGGGAFVHPIMPGAPER